MTLSVALLLLALTACTSMRSESILVVDLVHEFPRAERRPTRSAFEVVDYMTAARPRASLRTTSPSRIVFTLPIPRGSTFRVALTLAGPNAAPVRFRIGVSDDRVYEALTDRTITAADANAWTEVEADLSAYAGWKWSLFYRPERTRWRLVLNTDAITGAPSQAIWGAPAIYADLDAAREYVKRSLSLER